MLTFDQLPEINSERWLSLEDLEGEVWKDVVGYEDIYKVSNYGRVKSITRRDRCGRIKYGKMLRCHNNGNEYYSVNLRTRSVYIHRIVAQAFIPNDDYSLQVDHINTIRSDNRSINLRWVSVKENHSNPITIGHRATAHLSLCKPVVMLDENGKYEMEFLSAQEAADYLGLFRAHISAIICKVKNNTTAKGHQFVYLKDYNPQKDYSLFIPPYIKTNGVNANMIAVIKGGTIINVFKDAYEAEDFINGKYTRREIRSSCYVNSVLENCQRYGRMTEDFGGSLFYLKVLPPNMQDNAIALYKIGRNA